MAEKIISNALTLPKENADKRDFKASEAIKIDRTVELPESFSLWEWIYKTNNQGKFWSCTSNATSHWVQVLKVKKGWVKPTNNNIYTPKRQDLWTKMGHDMGNVNDSWDYVEKAVETAYKQWIELEEWGLAMFDAYATDDWDAEEINFDTMKRYIYDWKPIVWCMRWNTYTRADLRKWELKSSAALKNWDWWHAICVVGWDPTWLRILNSRSPNDEPKRKSRFHVDYNILLAHRYMFNRRYRVLYNKEDAKLDPEYLKNKNNAKLLITALKSIYEKEDEKIREAIIPLSSALRKKYPELNEEIPIN